MRFLGIDLTEWVALLTLITIVGTFVSHSLKTIQKHSDEHYKEMFDGFIRTSDHNTDMLKLEVSNLTKSIDNLSTSYDNFQLREQEHYTEHEKHLVTHDLNLQQHSDTLEDHENRIKSNEDDIDYLKDKLSQKKASGNP